MAKEVKRRDLTVAAVLSGNRNFEGRINPLVKASYLASPPMVVAFAIAGNVDIDLDNDPLTHDPDGNAVYLSDIWPSQEDIDRVISESVDPEMFSRQYSDVLSGGRQWNDLAVPKGGLYRWDKKSTYIREPPFFINLPPKPPPLRDIVGARALVLLGDSVTTDHISPAGSIPADSMAGRYLVSRRVRPADFNSYGSRRGNHEVMMRGTFGNIRLRNEMVPDREGSWTLHLPDGKQMSIYKAAMRYRDKKVPLVVLGGKEYGSGSSRDWAAKWTQLLGVRAVIARSYERIHRSNLVGMGVLPLEFKRGEDAESLGLTGHEVFDIRGMADLAPGGDLTVTAEDEAGTKKEFKVTVRLNSEVELGYLRNGGILHKFIRDMMRARST